MRLAKFINIKPCYDGMGAYWPVEMEEQSRDRDWIRVSEYVEVEFPPRPDAEIAELKARAKQDRRKVLEKQLAEVS